MTRSNTGFCISQKEIEIACSNGKTFYETMPSSLLNEEGVVSPELLAELLKETKEKYGFSEKNCTVVLPGNTTFFKAIDSPAISEEQLLLNLPYEFRDFVGDNAFAYNYDYVVENIERDKDDKPVNLHLLAAAGLKSSINDYAQIFRRGGLQMNYALPQELCVYNFFKDRDAAGKEYCLVGLDYDHTYVYIFKGNSLRACKTIDAGVQNIDKAIADEMNIDIYLAATHRKENYLNVLSRANIKIIYEKIAIEIMKTINFYRYEYSDSELNTMHFFSAGSDIDEYCSAIVRQVGFKKGNLNEILPDKFRNSKNAARCLISIGSIL